MIHVNFRAVANPPPRGHPALRDGPAHRLGWNSKRNASRPAVFAGSYCRPAHTSLATARRRPPQVLRVSPVSLCKLRAREGQTRSCATNSDTICRPAREQARRGRGTPRACMVFPAQQARRVLARRQGQGSRRWALCIALCRRHPRQLHCLLPRSLRATTDVSAGPVAPGWSSASNILTTKDLRDVMLEFISNALRRT